MTTAISSARLQAAQIPVRYRLVAAGVITALISFILIFEASNAYTSAYQLFNDIAVDSSVKVDASLDALQNLASINKFAADLIGYSQPTDQQQALATIYSNFQNFRDEMFTIRKGLSKAEEFTAYHQAEEAIDDHYWAQITQLIAARSVQDKAAAIQAFNNADQIFEQQIIPPMTDLVGLNYNAMLEAKASASSTIFASAAVVGLIGAGLALFVTGVSFWLRQKVRRYLTPGVDAAAVLAWLVTFVMVAQLAQLPEQLRMMVQDSYYSITACGRVIADANLANVTESAALNDPANASLWQGQFDQYVRLVTLRICGQDDCLNNTFSLNGADVVVPAVAAVSKAISREDSKLIDGVIPLMGNITFVGEVTTLEQARLAYLDYLNIDKRTRGLLANNQLDAAIQLNTGRNPGQSDEAFFRFISFMQHEEKINRDVFDGVWAEQQTAIPEGQLLFGTGSVLLVILLFSAGVYHRFKEL